MYRLWSSYSLQRTVILDRFEVSLSFFEDKELAVDLFTTCNLASPFSPGGSLLTMYIST
jgi:hypothetical protein